MNLLHSIKARINDSLINVVVEIPKGSTSKIEYDSETGTFSTDRVLDPKFSYPFSYGFVPETWSGDVDPLDAVITGQHPLETGSVVPCRIIGMLVTHDEKGSDTKLITVPDISIDPSQAKIESVDDLNPEVVKQNEVLFKNYKRAEPGKWVDIDGYRSKAEAEKILTDAINSYHQHFQK